ncbi:hypothetical protein CWI32_03145 [Acinetobacter pseudolwoffii]|uniref:Uncharacterized protein n=1 Tax=Acinetobacter pseudolwoffii TaxID=2053287 RepID=A0A2H9YVG2_9GAMM|nr:hypothetical protein CWI32_03145 [Acinetobacter pseudolwoffii]
MELNLTSFIYLNPYIKHGFLIFFLLNFQLVFAIGTKGRKIKPETALKQISHNKSSMFGLMSLLIHTRFYLCSALIEKILLGTVIILFKSHLMIF